MSSENGLVTSSENGSVTSIENGLITPRGNGLITSSQNGLGTRSQNGFVMSSQNGVVSSTVTILRTPQPRNGLIRTLRTGLPDSRAVPPTGIPCTRARTTCQGGYPYSSTHLSTV